MALTDEQKTQVAAWITEGLKPSDVQSRLESEFGLRVTYMEVRFLMDDLKLTPKDPVPPPEPPKQEEPVVAPLTEVAPPTDPGAPAAGVKVQVDKITRPGSVVSGHVTFSDGQIGEWYLDQMGRLGMVPPTPGYRPPEKDVAEFQIVLEQELVKLGL